MQPVARRAKKKKKKLEKEKDKKDMMKKEDYACMSVGIRWAGRHEGKQASRHAGMQARCQVCTAR